MKLLFTIFALYSAYKCEEEEGVVYLSLLGNDCVTAMEKKKIQNLMLYNKELKISAVTVV